MLRHLVPVPRKWHLWADVVCLRHKKQFPKSHPTNYIFWIAHKFECDILRWMCAILECSQGVAACIARFGNCVTVNLHLEWSTTPPGCAMCGEIPQWAVTDATSVFPFACCVRAFVRRKYEVTDQLSSKTVVCTCTKYAWGRKILKSTPFHFKFRNNFVLCQPHHFESCKRALISWWCYRL